MGGPFACYSFDLPKPILHILFLLNRISLAVSFLLILLRLRLPPPLPPSQPRSNHPSPRTSDQLSSPEFQPPSTSSSTKSRLPVVDFARLAGDSPSGRCVVCLRGIAASDEVRELGNCRHAFHRECIDRWIDADGFTCPLCRSPLLPPPEAEEGKEMGQIVKILTRIWRIPSSINLFISNLYVDNYL